MLPLVWALGLLSSGVMGPERQVLSPDGVPSPVALCVCRGAVWQPRLSSGSWGAMRVSPLHRSSLWGFFPPASKQGHGRVGPS